MNLLVHLLDHDTEERVNPKEGLKHLWVLRQLSEGVKLRY